MSRIILVISLFLIIACENNYPQKSSIDNKKITIIASILPVYEFTKNITKEKANIKLLLPIGIEPHNFEPTVKDIIALNNSSIFIYTNKYMEPWAEKIIKTLDNKNLLVIDASQNINLSNNDPHIWLDFSHCKKMIDNILEGLIKIDPDNKDFYIQNVRLYKHKLTELDKLFKDSLSRCKKHIFVYGGHFAFEYLIKKYGLEYISIYEGSSHEAEPTPQRLLQLINIIKKFNLNYIFYEEMENPQIANVIAKETKTKLLKLNSTHNISNYEITNNAFITIMQKNLDNLKIGLECQ